MNRRAFLRVGTALAGTAAVSGCLSDAFGSGSDSGEPPVVEDRPDAVYYPTHVEGMQMAGMTDAGEYMVALSYSFPHRFWLVTGQDRRKVAVKDDDSVHLMGSIWEPETGVVPPSGNLGVTVSKGGDVVAEKSLWAMLSQNMGFHFGDNVALDGDGTYQVDVQVGPVDARRTGQFQELFGEGKSVSFEFEYSRAERDEIMFQTLEDKQGERGAVEPMQMEMMPVAQVPPKGDLPGEVLGEATSGDGTFVVTALEDPPEGVDGSGTYLAVSARTPHNRYPLPFTSLSATLTRDGETVFDGPCEQTVDPALDYHYGAVVDGVESGDELALSVGAPPQVGRHEGYETAFLEMDDMELTVE